MRLWNQFRALLKGGTPGFNDFEHKVLNAVIEKLPPDAQGKLKARISSINLVQRLDGGREVNCFSLKGGHPALDEATRIDSQIGERKLARFWVETTNEGLNVGEVWLVDGNFFSIEFQNPTEHAAASLVKSVEVELSPSP